MTSWTDGYFSDFDYICRFYPELTPQLLRYVLLAQGYEAPDVPFTYCELGSGHGLSANIIAAANPDCQFFATDFMPTHTAEAQRLAVTARTPNVRFFDDHFEEFKERDLPEFDFICLHGVYSWISAENRKAVIEMLANKLKVGGIVYISYNCLPGWAAAMPLRELMYLYATYSAAPVTERVEEARNFVVELNKMKVGFFAENVNINLDHKLKSIQGDSRNQLAHEFLVQDWTPMYFAQVASELDQAKLVFAASVNPIDHFDSLTISPEAAEKLDAIRNPVFRETVLDFFVNRQFRRDIFVKGPIRLGAEEKRQRLMAERFALMIPRGSMKLKHSFPRGEIALQAELYEPILDALAARPMTLGELMAQPSISKFSFDSVLQAISISVSIGYIQPALRETGESERRVSTDRFNHEVRRRAHFSDQIQYHSSPVTGGGVRVSRIEQLYLSAHEKEQKPAAYIRDILMQQDELLRKGEKTLENEEDYQQMVEGFDARLPVLKCLGVA